MLTTTHPPTLKRIAKNRPKFNAAEVVVVTDDEENDEEGARLMKQAASRKYKNPADMRDVNSWQEGKEDLMIILQQVGVDLEIRRFMIQFS